MTNKPLHQLEIGDRVGWNSWRMNKKGIRWRTGLAIHIYDIPQSHFSKAVVVRPDPGCGRTQHLAMGRLRILTEGEKDE